MAYTINLTDGSIFATIPDGTINTTSSMTLVGKNYAGYGAFLDENFMHLLENSSNTTAPPAPVVGQLWWDKTNSLLKIYTTNGWKSLASNTTSNTAPSNPVIGDLWYDTVNQQLKIYTGASWIVVGPAYSSATGTSGAIPETINDSGGAPHFVTSIYVNNVRIAIISQDGFIPAAPTYSSFPYIYPGQTLNLSFQSTYSGNVASIVGNITGGNLNTTGISLTGNVVSALNVTGNITGPNLITTGVVTATGNITGANLVTAGIVTATGNITGGNLLYNSGQVSGTGNITGGNILTSGSMSATGTGQFGNILTGGSITATGNIRGGNFNTTGLISATGNITSAGNIAGTYFVGNGSQLTGITAAVTVSKMVNGTTEANIGTSDGNLTVTVAGTSNVMVVTTTGVTVGGSGTGILTANSVAKGGSNGSGNIGGATSYFQNGYIVNTVSTTVSATGNITGGNVNTGQLSLTGNVITALNVTGTITGGNVATPGTISSTGSITTDGILTVNSGNTAGSVIVNAGGNGVGNIGSAVNYFNTIFATATTALYADVAERFAADEILEPGTVVELGGIAEITKSRAELSDNIFGVISTKPAYTMNGGAGDNYTHPPVAMTGRVPVKVIGPIRKGDRLVSAGNGFARAARQEEITAFNVIGRALANKTTPDQGTIEAIVTIK